MVTRKKLTQSFVNMLKSYDDTFYGKHNLVQVIENDPLQFDKARASNKNLISVHFWISDAITDYIASQNHFETYTMDMVIHSNHSNRNNSIEYCEQVLEYIKKYTLDKEYNGLSLSQYYIDSNSSVISMTPTQSTLPPPIESDNKETVIIVEGVIEFQINIW